MHARDELSALALIDEKRPLFCIGVWCVDATESSLLGFRKAQYFWHLSPCDSARVSLLLWQCQLEMRAPVNASAALRMCAALCVTAPQLFHCFFYHRIPILLSSETSSVDGVTSPSETICSLQIR